MSVIELGTVCTCVYKLYVDEPVTVISVVFNFLLSFLLVVIGLKVNAARISNLVYARIYFLSISIV